MFCATHVSRYFYSFLLKTFYLRNFGSNSESCLFLVIFFDNDKDLRPISGLCQEQRCQERPLLPEDHDKQVGVEVRGVVVVVVVAAVDEVNDQLHGIVRRTARCDVGRRQLSRLSQ